jgi:hypothetical protein
MEAHDEDLADAMERANEVSDASPGPSRRRSGRHRRRRSTCWRSRARPGWRSTTPCSLSRAAEPRLPAVVAALVRVVAVRAAVVLVVGAALPVGSLRSVPRRAAQPLAVATGVARWLRGGRPSSALRGRRRLLRLGPALSRTARPARPIRHATLRAPGRGGTAPPLPRRRRHEAFAHAQTVSRFSPSRS